MPGDAYIWNWVINNCSNGFHYLFSAKSWSGVGVTKVPFVNSVSKKFSLLQRYLLDCLNHIYIWQVPPQLSRGDTCQIYIWYSIANVCIDNAEKFENNRKQEIGLVTLTPELMLNYCRLHPQETYVTQSLDYLIFITGILIQLSQDWPIFIMGLHISIKNCIYIYKSTFTHVCSSYGAETGGFWYYHSSTMGIFTPTWLDGRASWSDLPCLFSTLFVPHLLRVCANLLGNKNSENALIGFLLNVTVTTVGV